MKRSALPFGILALLSLLAAGAAVLSIANSTTTPLTRLHVAADNALAATNFEATVTARAATNFGAGNQETGLDSTINLREPDRVEVVTTVNGPPASTEEVVIIGHSCWTGAPGALGRSSCPRSDNPASFTSTVALAARAQRVSELDGVFAFRTTTAELDQLAGDRLQGRGFASTTIDVQARVSSGYLTWERLTYSTDDGQVRSSVTTLYRFDAFGSSPPIDAP